MPAAACMGMLLTDSIIFNVLNYFLGTQMFKM